MVVKKKLEFVFNWYLSSWTWLFLNCVTFLTFNVVFDSIIFVLNTALCYTKGLKILKMQPEAIIPRMFHKHISSHFYRLVHMKTWFLPPIDTNFFTMIIWNWYWYFVLYLWLNMLNDVMVKSYANLRKKNNQKNGLNDFF